MKHALAFFLFAIILGAGLLRIHSEEPITVTKASASGDLHFSQTAPYSDATNIAKHFGYTVPLPEYSITNELFQVRVPENLSTNEPWGLLVWISPSDEPHFPVDWQAELEKRRLFFVSAYHSGNSRHPLDRFRLALDAVCNMCRRYPVNPQRIYVGGFSGGSRIASMLGIAYADIFTGTLCLSGVNFYRDVAATDGKYYPATFTPGSGPLLRGKRTGRFVLLTGENDENRENTERISTKGFKLEGFRNVLYLEVPKLGHALPPLTSFVQALEYVSPVEIPRTTSQGQP